jgi:colanic acid biosynthesis glycosyl transferase WcaI
LAVALGKFPNSWWTRLLRAWLFRVYRDADRVVVLSEDMRALLLASGVAAERVVCIPNWVDAKAVQPIKEDNPFRARHGINGNFVVMYSGNLGLTQRLEQVLQAAELLRERADIRFFLVGNGALKADLVRQAEQRRLGNVRFLDYQPKSDLSLSLSAADLHLIPLHPALVQCLMPSKLYGILASGTAVLAITVEACELARVVRDRGVGIVVGPGDAAALADAIRAFADQREKVRVMGAAARQLAVAHYDRPLVTARFGRMVREVAAGVP